MSDLYERIETLCKQKNTNITQMCRDSGASRASLTDLKMGRKQNLSATTLAKIAKFFGVTIDALIGDNVLWLIAKNTGQETTASVLEEALAADALKKATLETENEKKPTPVSGSEPHVNIIKIAGRDGSFVEKRLTDKQMQALKSFVDLLPDAGDEL